MILLTIALSWHIALNVAEMGRCCCAIYPDPPDAAQVRWWVKSSRGDLGHFGQSEGATHILEERYADGDAARLGSLCDELVRSGVSMIVATGQPATNAVRRVTHAQYLLSGA